MNHLVLLCGRQMAGKTTLAGRINNLAHHSHDSCVYSFATALREVAKPLIGEVGKDPGSKLANCGWDWNELNEPLRALRSGPMTVRDMLQVLGTDIFRTYFCSDVWTNILSRQIAKRLGDHPCHSGGIYLIDDCRFPNELALHPRGIDKVWKVLVERPSLGAREDRHVSETALDGFRDWDEVCYNDSDLAKLDNWASCFLDRIMRD